MLMRRPTNDEIDRLAERIADALRRDALAAVENDEFRRQYFTYGGVGRLPTWVIANHTHNWKRDVAAMIHAALPGVSD